MNLEQIEIDPTVEAELKQVYDDCFLLISIADELAHEIKPGASDQIKNKLDRVVLDACDIYNDANTSQICLDQSPLGIAKDVFEQAAALLDKGEFKDRMPVQYFAIEGNHFHSLFVFNASPEQTLDKWKNKLSNWCEQYYQLLNLNNYLDVNENWFPEEIKIFEQIVKRNLVSNTKTLTLTAEQQKLVLQALETCMVSNDQIESIKNQINS